MARSPRLLPSYEAVDTRAAACVTVSTLPVAKLLASTRSVVAAVWLLACSALTALTVSTVKIESPTATTVRPLAVASRLASAVAAAASDAGAVLPVSCTAVRSVPPTVICAAHTVPAARVPDSVSPCCTGWLAARRASVSVSVPPASLLTASVPPLATML